MMREEMPIQEWVEEFPSAITVCDVRGKIVSMNKASRLNYAKRGGESLIGTSLFDCHSEASNKIIRKMLQKEIDQAYFTENKGKKRLVHQAPWFNNGISAGLVETIVDLPGDIEVRKRS